MGAKTHCTITRLILQLFFLLVNSILPILALKTYIYILFLYILGNFGVHQVALIFMDMIYGMRLMDILSDIRGG